MPRPKRLIILGSTGSIGSQTLDVVEHLSRLTQSGQCPGPGFAVVGLAAGNNAELLAAQARRFGVEHVAIATRGDGAPSHWLSGPDSAQRLVRTVECDLIVSAIVGSAGLAATLAGVEAGRDIALANKETLVAAGAIVVPAAIRSGSKLFPVDSEHSGVWQCLAGAANHAGSTVPPFASPPPSVSRVVLTASGGPFRTWSSAQIAEATPAHALKHPTWQMGAKVTLDSASLMNKALELIEAHWLFALAPEQLDAVIHPQSIVHAIVELVDGSSIAQLALPDMRTPIQLALAWPHRPIGLSPRSNLATIGRLDFEPIDPARFDAVNLARKVMRSGGLSGAVLNAANEEAGAAFLGGHCRFPQIAHAVNEAVSAIGGPLASIDCVHRADREARLFVRDLLGVASTPPSTHTGAPA
ncbi:MAG: 1-deoxy-D-xylulose-5-phosphate reductoisomerase [Planctomycetota bacterium]